MNAFSSWSGKFNPDYKGKSQLADIEKTLNYLDGGLTDGRDMQLEERAVIDEFEGRFGYEKTMMKQEYFIYNLADSIPCIGMKAKEG